MSQFYHAAPHTSLSDTPIDLFHLYFADGMLHIRDIAARSHFRRMGLVKEAGSTRGNNTAYYYVFTDANTRFSLARSACAH